MKIIYRQKLIHQIIENTNVNFYTNYKCYLEKRNKLLHDHYNILHIRKLNNSEICLSISGWERRWEMKLVRKLIICLQNGEKNLKHTIEWVVPKSAKPWASVAVGWRCRGSHYLWSLRSHWYCCQKNSQ